MHYRGGSEGLSYIERDLISLPELVGHLKDHGMDGDDVLLHWLCPGKNLDDGLCVLHDDSVCLTMSECVKYNEIAEVFVESMAMPLKEQMGGKTVIDIDGCSADEVQYIGEDKITAIEASAAKAEPLQHLHLSSEAEEAQESLQVISKVGESNNTSDSEYLPSGFCSSEEDEEAVQMNNNFKEFKMKSKAVELESLDEIGEPDDRDLVVGCDLEDGNSTSYADSSEEEEESFEEASGDEVIGKEDQFHRFDRKAEVPVFALGMKFSGKKDFKAAIIKYGLATRRVIKFIKDEGDRVKLYVTGPCVLGKTSMTESWLVTSFKDEHTCPQRRDNRLVTATRIADRFESLIRANPAWSLQHLQATVQREMFANVSVSNCKRAKAIVMSRWLDRVQGAYSKVYDYQEELLRSNPGSTVVVKLDPEFQEPVFQRFYVCFKACKQGFLAGCRKVIGLDGCFFKGACSGVLLCAVGRDANNQIYPIAWAVVEMETNDTWDWFTYLLCRDLQIGDGDGWVVISDQQKGILKAVQTWLPNAEHRNCARHIYANWRKKHKKKEFQKIFWKCAKASCISIFNTARAELAEKTPVGAQDIMNTSPHHWSRAWIKLGANCDSVDNNICESFNKWIVEPRHFPIISMLEAIIGAK
ncbi:hypothetical protein U9M48_039281 [Paspalum notatum var. saurae]|uniref:MULE transposase domain-containing protein n=1 Tax=Paspalum notatum var. saurae TaxID=547442 RepID=A0AAQ3UNM8_PASNO